jgi:hypothetical protein
LSSNEAAVLAPSGFVCQAISVHAKRFQFGISTACGLFQDRFDEPSYKPVIETNDPDQKVNR